ncbi:uncharacterized protein VP01_3632g1 [Puccinia sorghi]|uniref:Uncharacterized protein n=1 Tax=Puccinia sorghi TaxID=27349 RepID=A0A0L6UUP0_9BASI|nr:uncharacterized protein VP01_3632g1 [Puccinia sorghi]
MALMKPGRRCNQSGCGHLQHAQYNNNKMNSNNQRTGGNNSSMNPTKDMMSGMDSGMDDSKSLVTLLLENSPPKYILTEWLGLDLDLMNRDRNQGENQGLMGKMSSMIGGEGCNKRNDESGQHLPSKMMGGVGGGHDSGHSHDASMGDKVKGTFEQAKGKVLVSVVMNDPHTARKGEMRKNPAGADSNDIIGGTGI